MSRVVKVICDSCGKEIPVIKKKDIFGIEREYIQSGKLESLNFTDNNPSKFGVDFCKDCAHAIDMKVMKWKLEILSK